MCHILAMQGINKNNMNWIDSVLYNAKAHDGILSRRLLEPLLMSGCISHDETTDRLKKLLNDGLVEREENSFKLTTIGDQSIDIFYKDALIQMELIRNKIVSITYKNEGIELNGGITGLYFIYKEIYTFGFYPHKGITGEFLLNVKLPNLIGEAVGHHPTSILFSMNVIEKTNILGDIIKVHMKMLDEYFSRPA